MCDRASSSRSAKTGMRFRRSLSKGALLRVWLALGTPSFPKVAIHATTYDEGRPGGRPSHDILRWSPRLLGLRVLRARGVGLAGEDLLLGGLLVALVAARGADADRLRGLLGRDDRQLDLGLVLAAVLGGL